MSDHLRRTSAALAALTAVAALTAACGGGGAATDENGVTSITIGAPPVVGLGDLFTAQERRLFAANKLKVTVRTLNGGAQLLPALQAGSIQIGQSNVVSVLQAAQQHIGMKCFAAAFRSPSGPQLALVVSPKRAAQIRQPADLAGQTIAVNTVKNSNQLVASSYLQAHGVSPGSVHFMGMEYPEMPGALSSGRVAAAITDEPFTQIVLGRGARLLEAQPDKQIAPHPVYACWVASSDWLSDNRPIVRRFTKSLTQADQYMAAHPDYLPTILPKYTKVTPAMAKKVTLPHFTTSLTAADIRPWSQAAARFSITQSPIPPSQIVD